MEDLFIGNLALSVYVTESVFASDSKGTYPLKRLGASYSKQKRRTPLP